MEAPNTHLVQPFFQSFVFVLFRPQIFQRRTLNVISVHTNILRRSLRRLKMFPEHSKKYRIPNTKQSHKDTKTTRTDRQFYSKESVLGQQKTYNWLCIILECRIKREIILITFCTIWWRVKACGKLNRASFHGCI